MFRKTHQLDIYLLDLFRARKLQDDLSLDDRVLYTHIHTISQTISCLVSSGYVARLADLGWPFPRIGRIEPVQLMAVVDAERGTEDHTRSCRSPFVEVP